MAHIVEKLEAVLAEYLLHEAKDFPELIYLGEKECFALDKHFGGIVQDVFNLEIVMVMKGSWITFGDR